MKKFNLKKALEGKKLVYRNGEEVKGEFKELVDPIGGYTHIITSTGQIYTPDGEIYTYNKESGYDLFMKGKQTTTDKIEAAFEKHNSREQFKDEVLAILARKKARKDKKKAIDSSKELKELRVHLSLPVRLIELPTTDHMNIYIPNGLVLNPEDIDKLSEKKTEKPKTKEELREILFNWLDEKGVLKEFLVNVAKADKEDWNYEEYLVVGKMDYCIGYSFKWTDAGNWGEWDNLHIQWIQFCKEQGI